MKFALVAFGNEESYGLLFVGGALLAGGQDIRFFDAEMGEEVAGAVLAWAPDAVCLSPLTAFIPAARAICRELKQRRPALRTIIGGHHALADPSLADLPEFDAVVVGPVHGAVARLLAGASGCLRTEPTVPADLPAPARRECYRDIPRLASRYRKFMLSRLGCPWHCAYCSAAGSYLAERFGAAAWRRYFLGRRPLADLLAEARVIAASPTAEVEWVDDDFFCGSDRETWLPPFIDAWRREIGLPLYVSTTSRGALQVSDAVLRQLRSVVTCIGMGIQAVRPDSLRLLGRAWDSEAQMQAAYDRLAAFGFRVNLQGIVGLPVDDPVGDALDTVRALQRIGPGSVCSCYPLQVYPGTRLQAYCREHGFAVTAAGGDTSTGLGGIVFPEATARRLRNLCKFATPFVQYGIGEHWLLPLLDLDLPAAVSRDLSLARYRACVCDRLPETGAALFPEIIRGMNLRY